MWYILIMYQTHRFQFHITSGYRGVGRGGAMGAAAPPPLEKRGKGKEKKGGKKRRSEMEAKHSEWKDKPVISIA